MGELMECEGCVMLLIPLVLIWGAVVGIFLGHAVDWIQGHRPWSSR
jgi:hypothetical protein